ncbi:neuropeptide FF receptor 1, partial [Biomphalaria glabrata]
MKERLVGKSFGTETLKIEVVPIEEKKKSKITLHWISPTIAKRSRVEIFKGFAEEGSRVDVAQIGTFDKWVSSIK